jgi:hypothetical protein
VKTSSRPFRTAVVATALVLLVSGCSTRSGVVVSRDEGADFSQYPTWSWLELAPEDETPPSQTERRLSARVQRQIQRELHWRGYRYRTRNADLGIDSRLIIEREKHIVNQTTAIQTVDSLHHSRSIQVQATERDVEFYQRGRLTIRAIDLRRNTVVWRAVYEERFRDSIEPHVGDVVAKTLARFPATERRDHSLALNSNQASPGSD